jgi:hypothetical protein
MNLRAIRESLEAAWDRAIQAHREEHYRCFELGEGPQVPVRCSCGERFGPTWVQFEQQIRDGRS